MKKYIGLVFIFTTLIAITPSVTFAGIEDAQSTLKNIADGVGVTINVKDPEAGIAEIVGGVVKTILAILGIAFMAITVYGGWLWMTAAGNQERVGQAKNLLRDAIIGIIIVVAAFAITSFVVTAITNSIG